MRKYLLLLLCAVLLAPILAPLTHAWAENPNLIANASVEQESAGKPLNWNTNSWGANTPTFTYETNGRTGNRSLSVSIANHTSGDAKWMSDQIAVTAGETYTYTDYSKSTAPTELDIAYINTAGVTSFAYLTTIPASTDWRQNTINFTVPTGMTSLSIYHILYSNGSLQTDDFSLVSKAVQPTPPVPPTDPTTTPTNNLIPNASFETVAPNGTQPADWEAGNWGSNTPAYSYETTGHTGNRSAKVTISNYVSGDAKWAFTPIKTLTPGSQYSLSAWYKTNTQPHVVATYVDTAGVDQYLTLPAPLPGANAATEWQQYSTQLNVPANAVSVSVYFLIASNGWLQTDDFSLTSSTPVGFESGMVSLAFDDGWSNIYANGLPLLKKYSLPSTQYLISGKLNTSGYMTTAQAKAFQSAGHEIGSHTVTHANLTALTSTKLTNELANSQTKLRQLFGANTAQSFASPYGSYNATSLTAIQRYYTSHRSTDTGFNTKDSFNPYNITVQNIKNTTTPAEVAAWVAKAKANKSWLVLVYHSVKTNTSNDEDAVTPANLNTELSAIKASGIPVKTVSQALAALKSQL